MEGDAAAAVLQVLVQNLIDHSKKEISLIRGLEKEAAKLTGNLDTIQKFLNDAETPGVHGEAVKSWLKKLENFAFDADNVLDEFSYHLLSKKIKALKPIKEKVLLSCFPSFNRVGRPRKMALRIEEINENLDSIKREAAELQLVERLAADGPTSLDAAFETASFTFDPIFVGRDDDVSRLVEMLTTSGGGAPVEPAIFAIVGMGGLGKTTLTRRIFNRLKEETRFGSYIWVHVSQNFDPITLFKKMLKELICDDQVQVESKQEILRKLQEALKDKTYLLVLDDVWNQDLSKWEDFMNSLLGVTSISGNAIVVTSRSTEVASIVNPLHTHELEGLSEEDCWSIIEAKAFGREGDVPSELEAIGRKIARRCQGLPLAANVVGGVLRRKSEEKWLEIEQKWLSRDEGNNIVRILRLSYDSLSPPSLKKCFAYCSVFPKGREFRKQQLIEYWMAEGFLRADASNDVVELLGERFIDVLLQNSLLQAADRDEFGNVESCVMHDLVHDLADSVLGTSDNADGLRRVRYMNYSSGDEPSCISREEAKHVRTLFFEGEISSTIFSDFEGLHVLVLDGYLVGELPSSIRKLIHLRNLTISRSIEIERLPEWIGELHHLQTLRAEAEDVMKLPSTIKYLINLRHLYVTWRTELPAEIGRLTSLQTLRYFTVGDGKGFRIEELGSLNNLKGELAISSLERVGSKEEAEKANLFKKSKLLELCLRWDRTIERKRNNDEDVLEGLEPHPELKKLVIDGFQGTRFPSWTMEMAVGNVGLKKLIEISLRDCSECEEIPMLGHLPCLKSLELQGLSYVKRIGSSFYGFVNAELTTQTAFPALERLEMADMPELAEWEGVQVESASKAKVFPRLRYLEINGCERLMSVPSHFSPCLKSLLIEKSGVEYLPDRLFIDNPDLSELDIKDCPKLRELPQGLCTLGSLKIRDCPSLERIADDPRGGGSLNHVEIFHCEALSYLPCELVGSSLQELRLLRLPSLKNLPGLIDSLQKSPRLTDLTVVRVPNFIASSSPSSSCVEIWPSFPNLTDVYIDLSTEGSSSSSGSMETVDGILKGCCHSLERLELVGVETWECLPGSMQLLEALSLLNLENIGMEELPEWFGNLSSLEQLSLRDCKRLRRLPSVDAMRRLTALEWLEIEGSPELHIDKRRQQQSGDEEGDSEWDKVCHVLNITIDGLRIQSMYD